MFLVSCVEPFSAFVDRAERSGVFRWNKKPLNFLIILFPKKGWWGCPDLNQIREGSEGCEGSTEEGLQEEEIELD